MSDLSNQQAKLSFAKKLGIAFAMMLAATVALGVASLSGIGALNAEFDNTSLKTAKRLDLASQMGTSVTQMLSVERGVLVQAAVMDQVQAEGYHNQFVEASKILAGQLSEIGRLITLEKGKQDLAAIEKGLAVWLPAHQDLWQAVRRNQAEGAIAIYDKRTLPQGKEMQKAAEDLRVLQNTLLAQAVESGHSQVSRSYWIVSGTIALFVAVWGAALWVVRRASAGQDREAELKIAAARDLTQLLEKIGRTSQGLTISSNELTGISQEMAGAAEETATQANVVSAASEQVSKNVEWSPPAPRN
jgi:CHASE3 domain sensor protein